MVKLKGPLSSLDARGTISKAISFVKRQKQNIAEKKPEVKDVKSAGQLSWRHMFLKCTALWHALSAAERLEWEALARAKHMTGYAYWQSQCLKPNPGIYLPLQGGNMQGEIDMGKHHIEKLPAPVDGQDADTMAARDAAIAAALADPFDVHLFAYDGADWQNLRTQDNTFYNLRVAIFDSANQARVFLTAGSIGAATGGLVTHSFTRGKDGAGSNITDIHRENADTKGTGERGIMVSSYPYGFNGATWDRLRSYAGGIQKTGRAKVGLLTARKVGAGQVGTAAPHDLYWMLLNPSAGNSLVELTDAVAALGVVVADHFDTARDGHMITFDPPIEFTTGIYLETFTNMTSITFGYI